MTAKYDQNLFRVGIDIGGTFTDIVFSGEDGTILTKKLLSTPDNYSRAILDGINSALRENGLSGSSIEECTKVCIPRY